MLTVIATLLAVNHKLMKGVKIMNFVIKLIRKAVLGYRASGEDYINYLRDRGCSIGENVVIFSPNTTTIDVSRPVLLEIGNQVRITGG